MENLKEINETFGFEIIPKFRIWNKITNSWLNIHDFAITGNGELIYNHDHSEWTTYISEQQFDLVIQHFSGLRDVNKKDIYEGDIVKHEYLMRTKKGYSPTGIFVNAIIKRCNREWLAHFNLTDEHLNRLEELGITFNKREREGKGCYAQEYGSTQSMNTDEKSVLTFLKNVRGSWI